MQELFNLIKKTRNNPSGDCVDWWVVREGNNLFLLFEESKQKKD